MPSYFLDARTVTPHFPGIGRYVRNLAQALIPQLAPDERLSILWSAHPPGALPPPSAWNPASLSGPRVETIPVPCSPFSLAQQWQVPRLLGALRKRPRPTSKSQQSLYHSTYYLMPYCPGLPTVLTVYDLTPMLHPQVVSPRARLFFRLTTHLALHAAGHLITISEATRRDLFAHFSVPAGRVTAIPLAADARFQPQSPARVEAVRRKYNLPDRYVFYLGINKPHKNLVRLVDAWRQLHHSPPTIQHSPLVIAGAWDERYPEPKQRAEQHGLADHIRFLGPVDDADLPALYSGCTLFVFPSIYEGFGLPVLEAMACGAPVACSNTSSLPEAAGDAALLFDPKDVADIAATMQRVLSDADLRRSLAERSLQQAQQFSWQRTARETLALYRRVVRVP